MGLPSWVYIFLRVSRLNESFDVKIDRTSWWNLSVAINGIVVHFSFRERDSLSSKRCELVVGTLDKFRGLCDYTYIYIYMYILLHENRSLPSAVNSFRRQSSETAAHAHMRPRVYIYTYTSWAYKRVTYIARLHDYIEYNGHTRGCARSSSFLLTVYIHVERIFPRTGLLAIRGLIRGELACVVYA